MRLKNKSNIIKIFLFFIKKSKEFSILEDQGIDSQIDNLPAAKAKTMKIFILFRLLIVHLF